MKKLLMALAFVASGMISANAQNNSPAVKAAPVAKPAPAAAKVEAAKPAPAQTAPAVQTAKPDVAPAKKQETVKPAPAKAADGTVLKKDGTPDKRHKAKGAKGASKK